MKLKGEKGKGKWEGTHCSECRLPAEPWLFSGFSYQLGKPTLEPGLIMGGAELRCVHVCEGRFYPKFTG